jgi:uncharacterized protein YicC (UPF0701 family)
MRTTDIFKTKAKKLNESFEKTFGQKLKLETFTVAQLEDARNRLRTQIHQVRNGSNFNETVENEAYTKAQWMLDSINAELAERFEDTAIHTAEPVQAEGHDSLEEKVKELLDRFEQDAMEIGAYGNVDLEGVVSLIAQGDYEGAADEVYGSYSDQDGGEVPNIEPYIKDLQDEFEMLAQGGDEDQGGETDDGYALASAGYGSDEDYESINPQGEDMKQVRESAADKAGAVVVAKDMTDKVSRWIEELSGLENDTLLSLGDTIRDEMGQEQAKAYLEAVAPAIQQALQNLKQTRETLATGMRGLTGEAQPAEIIGSEPEEGGEDDMAALAEPDAMNMPAEEPAVGDEFAAAEPAAGGAETAGREKRESIERQGSLLKILAG